ncbi:MAG: EthD family reductase [Actinomycetales bacterium]
MITVYILYPKSGDSTFDMDYYTATHLPMLARALGEACVQWGATSAHGDDYHAVGWANVTSAAAFDAAMAEHGAAIMADVANYTSVEPVLLTGDTVV